MGGNGLRAAGCKSNAVMSHVKDTSGLQWVALGAGADDKVLDPIPDKPVADRVWLQPIPHARGDRTQYTYRTAPVAI
jgi:hypothetical protein